MTARVFRLIGAALVWAVVLVTCGVLVLVCLPLLVLIAVGRGVVGAVGWLARRGDVAVVPDDLDDVLRARIDGDGEAYAAKVLGCGCPRIGLPVVACPGCDWVTCLAHAGAGHLCEPAPITGWQNAPLPVADAARDNEAFADLIDSARELGDLRNSGRTLSRYYLIGEEK